MKKKAYLLLIASSMALASCSWQDLMFWKKWGWGKKDNEPAETIVVDKDDVIEAFNKLSTLNSFTSVTHATMSGDNTLTVGEHKVPSYQTITIDYTNKKVGKNTKTNSSFGSTTLVNLEAAEAVEGVTKEETMDALVSNRNLYIQFGYDASLSFDLAKQEACLVIPFNKSETYTIYDEEAKQTYNYSVDDSNVKYNYEDDDTGIIDTESLIEVVNKGTVEGNTIKTEIEGETVSIQFELKDGYVSSLEAEVSGTHIKISYSDFNKTSFDIPASCHKPICKWPHDSKNAFSYVKTETGHRKYCQECHKFLDHEQSHDHSHNDKGFCEICGYVDGEDDVESTIIQGFENGEDPYLKAKVIGEIIVSSSINYDYDFACYGSSVDYRVYKDAGVVLAETSGDTSRLDGACVEIKTLVFDLYKGLSQSELQTIQEISNSSDRTEALVAYLQGKTISKSFSGKSYRISHGLTTSEETTLDECHQIMSYTCSDCGQLTSAYISAVSNHESNFTETEEIIDACHTLVNKDCPTCHEHKEEIKTNHVEGEPVVIEKAIDSCHTLRIEKCATCGEVINTTIVANHTGHTSTRTVSDGNGGTKTITSCDSCHAIISIA